METYLAGPLFLVKASGALPDGVLTVSHCLSVVAPDTWAIEWVNTSPEKRLEAAARCGITAEQLPAVIEWTTQQFEKGFAWSHVFVDASTAREFRSRFLPSDFRLLQIGLSPHFAESFLALAAPPAAQPGFAPIGATGTYEMLLESQPLVAGERRGFEILGYERHGGGFDSFRCHSFEPEFEALGVSFNECGLVADESDALRCAEYLNRPEVQSCADGWHPWLVVEHPL